MKANLKRIQIDLDAEDVSKLKALAASRGHLLKPFIEYLLKVQIGVMHEVTPVKAQPLPLREPPAEDTAQELREAITRACELREELRAEETPQRESKAVTLLKWLKGIL